MSCRRSQQLGFLLIAGGVGILLSLLLPSTFWKILVALGLFVVGYLIGKS